MSREISMSPGRRAFAASVLRGLTARPKTLEAKWLYDETGSALFDDICTLPEYYPTRTETAILAANAAEIARHVPAGAALVELGSGSSVKTRHMLDALPVSAYLPVDISGSHLRAAADRIAADHPSLDVRPVEADFTRAVSLPEDIAGRPLALFFPGSTIGNFEPEAARALLAGLRRLPGVELLIIGVDRVKEVAPLVAAYDDAAGVTAAFTLNILTRINRELGADFVLAAFDHEARWNPALARVEAHLVSRNAQTVTILGREIAFEAGESIHAESSHKYTDETFAALAAPHWRLAESWTDERAFFSVHLLEPG